MELSWSQTPSRVWWALSSGASVSSLGLDSLRSPSSSIRSPGDTLRREKVDIFYNYADETDYQESEEEISEWLKEHRTRGVIRVFQPGSSYSELIKCDVDTTTETIMTRCLAKELYVHYGCKKVRRVKLDEHPLQLQIRFFQELGHCNPYRIRLEALHENLSSLFKFVAGQEKGNRPEDKVQLSCPLKVKELNGTILPVWNNRFCVLCGSRMFVFATSRPRGKPTLVIDLRGGTVEEYKSKKYSFCLKITALRGVVILAFNTRMEQSTWLERAGKIISRHPLEANLAGHSLEKIPKYFFLNYNIIALNLAHNFMIESFEQTDAALLGHSRTIGWISDIVIFHQLISLSLSDNCLEQFPLSLCGLTNLQELDLSCNGIRILPHDIKLMTKLTTLLLHSNQLTELPYSMSELKHLCTLVIAFNRFFKIPEAIKDLPMLRIFIASGNHIRELPEDINRMESLQHFDIRFNNIKTRLPNSVLGMRNLVRLNMKGSGISDINMAHLLYLEFLNCSDNALRSLALNEGPMQSLIARNNKITQLSVPMTCEQLTSIDVSKNELTSLPESLAKLQNLEKLDASDNKLTKLPSKIFMMKSLLVLRASNNRLVILPQTVGSKCFLRTLDLHNNQITSLPPDLLTECIMLEVLNVSSNRLSSLSLVTPSIEPHHMLEFYAASNSLKDTCFSTISSFRKLKVLHLAYNGLCNIPSGFFSVMKSLEYLNLSGNSFSSIPPILGCPRLCCLLLHSNKIHALPSLPLFHQLHTLDLSCNQFENVPTLDSFPRLKYLDLSGNSNLVISEESEKRLMGIDHCDLERILDVKAILGQKKNIDTGGTTTHGKWSYGSGQVIGINSSEDCTAQVKSASMNSRVEDGLFAVMDGGRSPKVPRMISDMLEETLVKELENEEREGFMDLDPLHYLTYTFLTAHRKLEEVGQQYGSSAVVCHIHMLANGSYVLNVANTGLGEAILCRNGRAVPLTTPHSPTTNIKERARIADARGFISQDGRVNAVCGASRLMGVYHLWPQIIPIPSTESVELRMEDEYIIIATDSLWKYITYEQIIHEVRSMSDLIQAAKRLRDLAVAYGSQVDVSVVVIKLNIDRNPPILPKPFPLVEEISEMDSEDEEEEELGMTNIDDPLSDFEPEEDKSSEEGRKIPVTIHATVEDDIDRMVLNAISSPLRMGMEDNLTLQSTNFDDLSPISDESLPSSMPMQMDFTPPESPGKATTSNDKQLLKHQVQMDYEAQTLPKIAQNKRSGGFTDLENSFEQTQSVPTLQVKWTHQSTQELSNPVSNQLNILNAALNQLNEDGTLSSTYHMESIERPRKRGITKRLSYVEHSYKQLTNDTYSGDSLHPVKGYTNITAD